jgi:hypothetical protein
MVVATFSKLLRLQRKTPMRGMGATNQKPEESGCLIMVGVGKIPRTYGPKWGKLKSRAGVKPICRFTKRAISRFLRVNVALGTVGAKEPAHEVFRAVSACVYAWSNRSQTDDTLRVECACQHSHAFASLSLNWRIPSRSTTLSLNP